MLVALRQPPYELGASRYMNPPRGPRVEDESIQAGVPLFNKYDVPLVLTGQDDDYQRSTPINGITYVVSGDAATHRPTGHQDFTAVNASIRHFLDLAISPTTLTGRAIHQDGNLIDSFQLRQ